MSHSKLKQLLARVYTSTEVDHVVQESHLRHFRKQAQSHLMLRRCIGHAYAKIKAENVYTAAVMAVK